MENFSITLTGTTFSDVILQAKNLVSEAEKFEGSGTKTKTKKAAAQSLDDDADTEETDTEELDEDTETDTEDEASFDSADEDEISEETDEDEEAPATKTKTKVKGNTSKSKKLSAKDVNNAVMEYSKVNGRKKTAALLLKKFKVKSILELKEDQYATVIKAVAV